MFEITVDTAQLRTAASRVVKCQKKLAEVQSGISSLRSEVDLSAYDGQLSGIIESAIADLQAEIDRSIQSLEELDQKLNKYADAFEAANDESSGFTETLKGLFLGKSFRWNNNLFGAFGLMPMFMRPSSIEQVDTGSRFEANSLHTDQGIKPNPYYKEYWNNEPTGDFGVYLDTQVHNGIDIVPNNVNKFDATVYPIGPGKVTNVDYGPKGLGHYVEILHQTNQGEIVSTYAHLQPINLPEKYTEVNNDSQIGVMGETGNASGEHVHLTIHEKSVEKDSSRWDYLATVPNTSRYIGANFDDQHTNGKTYLEQMKDNWIDPTQILFGETDLEFYSAE